MKVRSPNRKRNMVLLAWSMVFLATFIVIVLVIGAAIYQGPTGVAGKGSGTATARRGGHTPTVTRVNHTPTPVSSGTPNPVNQYVDISNGNQAFDINRPDGNYKVLASNYFKIGDFSDANIYWKKAIAEETNDAEALIYLEDQQVVASGKPYITFVVGTMLTGANVAVGQDNLQGAYVAQKDYNDGVKLPNGVLVRLLIANAGDQATNAIIAAQEIVQLAQTDTTIVGVMGWPFSSYVQDAVNILAQAQIPMISPTASSDLLTGISPYFFRVVPSNNSQAIAGAKYAENQLHAKTVALFVDSNDPYSSSLANDFKNQFTQDGNQIVATENYTVGTHTNLKSLLQDAMNASPDLIYFAGYANDMGVLLTDLPPNPTVQLMGGDALYELNAYPPSARAGFKLLHFTAFAYPDEWKYQKQQQPPFFSVYAEDFDPLQLHTSVYTFGRPDSDAILSYDAMFALLQASRNALAGSATSFTPNILQQNLITLAGFQGVSGQISFGSNGDPVNKATVILYVDPHGDIQILSSNGVQGCFLLGKC